MPSKNITPDDPRVVACRIAKAMQGVMALAESIGAGRQAVNGWKVVPAEHVLAVERATGISRHELRPDVFGPAPPRRKVRLRPRTGEIVAAD